MCGNCCTEYRVGVDVLHVNKETAAVGIDKAMVGWQTMARSNAPDVATLLFVPQQV